MPSTLTPDVFFANTAILSGDAMLIAAYQLIGSTEHGHLKQVLDLFTQTAAEICGGQQFYLVYGRFVPSFISFIHQVVVQQGEVMENFQT